MIRIFSFLFIGGYFLSITEMFSQQPLPGQQGVPPRPVLYMLKLIPKSKGKTYTIISKTKVTLRLTGGSQLKGKVIGVTLDSISVNYRSIAVNDIVELSYNPGSTLGAAAAIAAAVGVGAVAIVGEGGKDKMRDDTENAIYYTGLGLAIAGAITLIPTYFIPKKFDRIKYDFETAPVSY